MVGHVGSSVGSYLADPTSPIPSHCASIVVTSTLRVNMLNILFLTTSQVSSVWLRQLAQVRSRIVVKLHIENTPVL